MLSGPEHDVWSTVKLWEQGMVDDGWGALLSFHFCILLPSLFLEAEGQTCHLTADLRQQHHTLSGLAEGMH